MWANMQRAFVDALERAGVAAARIVPGLLALVVVLLLFVGVAIAVRVGLMHLLGRVDLDRRATRWGFAEVQESWGSLTVFVARLGFWVVVIAGFLVGLQVFDATSALALRMLAYIPQILLALVLFGAGVAAARFFEHAALIGAVNLQFHSARLVSVAVKWLVLVFAGALAFEHLGIGGILVPVAFAILFGGVVLAVALAVGLGSRDVVRRSWEERLDVRRTVASGEIRHL